MYLLHSVLINNQYDETDRYTLIEIYLKIRITNLLLNVLVEMKSGHKLSCFKQNRCNYA